MHWRSQKCVLSEGFASLSFPLFSSFPLSSLKCRTSKNQVRVWKNTVKSPSSVRGRAQPKSNLVHCSFNIGALVAIVLIIFLKINWPNWHVQRFLNVCLNLVWRIKEGLRLQSPATLVPHFHNCLCHRESENLYLLGVLQYFIINNISPYNVLF